MVELLVVISIMAVLAVALGFTYQGWQGSFKVENAVKQLHADLMTARTQAMSTKSTYLADFPTATPTASTYRIANDTNGNGAIDTGAPTEVLPTFPKTVPYQLVGGVLLTFGPQGLISSGNPAGLIDPADPLHLPVTIRLTSTNTPDYDCIIMSQSGINIGLMAAGVCNAK